MLMRCANLTCATCSCWYANALLGMGRSSQENVLGLLKKLFEFGFYIRQQSKMRFENDLQQQNWQGVRKETRGSEVQYQKTDVSLL